MDSSSEEFEDLNCIEEGDLDDISDGPTKVPHFLDYAGEELQFSGYSSLPETGAAHHANDLDKNNENEKSAIVDVPLRGGPEYDPAANRVPLLTRRRSAAEVQPLAQANTGTRKKEFSTSMTGGCSNHSNNGAALAHLSLDYDTVPNGRGVGDKSRSSSSSTTNRHINIAVERDLVTTTTTTTRRPLTGPMTTSMSSYLEHGNGSLRSQPPQPSSTGGGTWPDAHNKHNPARRTVHEMGPKVECVYSLLSMLGSRDIKVTAGKFLELSKSPDTCTTLRRSGCIPLFVQMIHSDSDETSRRNAAQALHNVVHCHPDDKVGRRESKVLKLIETVMAYCEYLKRDMHKSLGIGGSSSAAMEEDLPSPSAPPDRHPSQAIVSLMKISFDEEHRHAMCHLGALQAIAQLVHLDHAVHGMQPKDSRCVSLRRYAGMALTNLTFGDGNNKALLCSNKEFMRALVAQLSSVADDLIQVTASVLRNLSWRADNNMITVLNEIGTVTALTAAAMKNNNMENTLKAILSALWNLSAHCSANKAEFCRVVGALAFLVEMLTYDAPSKTLTIVENAGGILRNVSSHIAVREDYRQILRQRDCLGILLQQLRSSSLTIVSNACGTLWNLSARCPTDQKYLWENGAVPMLRSLIHSKHKMISNGSNAALKNLLNYRPGSINHVPLDSVTRAMNLKELPSLSIRKQRALEQELDRKLSDTCEIIDMKMSPKREKVEEKVAGEGGLMMMRGRSEEEEETQKVVEVESVVAKGDDEAVKSERKEDEEMPVDGETVEDAPLVSMNVAPPDNERPQQETELDQITDYSLRYEQEEGEQEEEDQFNGNEIILILEDTVKCYEEEGTPYTISNATSMTDLRRESHERRLKVVGEPQNKRKSVVGVAAQQASLNSGLQTPEKPFKYAEEGTPGCFSTEFSRIGSLSSLEGDATNGSPPKEGSGGGGEEEKKKKGEEEKLTTEKEGGQEAAAVARVEEEKEVEIQSIAAEEAKEDRSGTPPLPTTMRTTTAVTNASITKASPGGGGGGAAAAAAPPKSVSFIDYAQETPLMFSRTSSLESLSSAEPACGVDDVGSVVSEFSRVASGIISPSELPDSPTQSVPQSPSRRRRQQGAMMTQEGMRDGRRQVGVGQLQQSVFEDKLDTFDVENTPAQFSCATSLSNLSFLNEENSQLGVTERKQQQQEQQQQQQQQNQPVEATGSNTKEVETEAPIKPTPLQDTDQLDSDDSVEEENGEGDDELLDTCVNMGMSRRAKGEFNPDFVRHYYTEDTPAHLSKAASNSDLSVLSMLLDNANQCEVVHDDSSSSSSSSSGAGDDDDGGLGEQLLQECIANGIENQISKGETATTTRTTTERTRREKPKGQGVVAVQQQQQRRDSLSSLSIDSDGDDSGDLLEQVIAAGMNRVARRPEFIVGASGGATVQPTTTVTANVNDSMSSLDSCESNGQSHLLFEQCLQSGMEKRSGSAAGSTSTVTAQPPPRPQKPRAMVRQSQSQSQGHLRPTRVAPPPRHVEYHRTDDEALLQECINMGIEKNVQPSGGGSGGRENVNSENILARQNQDIMRRIERMTLEEKFGRGVVGSVGTVSSSKNANGASVDTQESCAGAAAGILPTGQDTRQRQQQQPRRITGDGETEDLSSSSSSFSNRQKCRVEGSTDAPRNGPRNRTRSPVGIINSINGFDALLLEQSNEYPALKSSSTMMAAAEQSPSGGGQGAMMVASNEYMVDSVSRREALAVEKHKDPEQMLKSVDRLTHVLVTTAEYLRAHDVSAASELEAKRQMEGSCEDGSTWTENTCPNGDVSFPSLSFAPPKIDARGAMKVASGGDCEENTATSSASLSLNKITESSSVIGMDEMRGSVTAAAMANGLLATNLPAAVSLSQQNSKSLCGEQENVCPREERGESEPVIPMDAATPQPNIRFEIGGQVKTSAVFSFANNSGSGSVTSLDIDDIQPPSEMEGVSYNNVPGGKLTDSPQMSSLRNRKAGLSSTLVARRAIAGHCTTTPSSPMRSSVDSLQMTTNLENIAPPSLMDELLDSMMSVDSITSEVASDPLARTLCAAAVEQSQYETALSDNEDDTMTLRSCRELPLDGNGSSSNASSNQSTPVKRRHGSITPKMKREMARERFKTYTVDSPGELMMLAVTMEQQEKVREEEGVQVVPTKQPESADLSPEKTGGRVSAKQRRQENRSRFQTQILDYSEMRIFEIAPKEEEVEEGENTLKEEVDLNEEEGENEVEMNGGDAAVLVATEEKKTIPEKQQRPTTTVIKKTLMRLIKPVGDANQTDTDTNKSVRGRRKPEYVSPYRRTVGASPQTPGSPATVTLAKGGKSGIVARKSLPATGFMSKLKQVATPKKSPAKVSGSPKEQPIQRQGTFTKEEPSSNGNLPKVSSLPATPTKRVSKLPLVGGISNGSRRSIVGSPATTTTPTVGNGGVIKRQISAPAGHGQGLEKRKSMIASPYSSASKTSSSLSSYSNGQLSERSTSTASIKSNGSGGGGIGKTPLSKTGSGQERRLPLSMPASRSNSTMGTPRTPTTTTGTGSAAKMSLYGRAKGLIPVTLSARK